MQTYLFAWNPERWQWDKLDEQIERVGLNGQADDEWSTGNTKSLPAGSRFFLIRLGTEPKGIIGSGLTLTSPQPGPHWDVNQHAGAEALYADIMFDFLSRDVLVTWEELQQPPFSAFHWGIRASGVKVPESLAEALEAIWEKRTSGNTPLSPVEIVSVTALPEGARRRVTVNAYERNPAARAACIAHHGPRCKVCDTDLGERFGPIASGFVHVHHLVPISTVGNVYRVDPLKDLVPVCPTCHSVLHLRVPPLSVSEARDLLKTHSSVKG
jgi:5-methylcytosine-specific restriction enzyme A